jgi:hypothetical protein
MDGGWRGTRRREGPWRSQARMVSAGMPPCSRGWKFIPLPSTASPVVLCFSVWKQRKLAVVEGDGRRRASRHHRQLVTELCSGRVMCVLRVPSVSSSACISRTVVLEEIGICLNLCYRSDFTFFFASSCLRRWHRMINWISSQKKR